MPALAVRVKETSTSTGTGNFTLAGADTGFQSFNTAFGLNNRLWYVIEGGAEWEAGIGYLSNATTLVRETVVESSNTDSLVNFSAGTKLVFCSPPARALRNATRGRTLASARGFDMP